MPSKQLPKPVSERTLQRKYTQLAEITHGRIDVTAESGRQLSSLLHRYFAAFSNLYGTIPLRTAWQLFCETEPDLTQQKKILRKDFFAFSDILRAELLPYYVLNENEIWPEESDDKPINRTIVNKKLIGRGYYRFHDLMVLMDSQADKPYVLLEKAEYLAWADPDHFRESPCARDLLRFLKDLRVASDSKNLDIEGRPIHGKNLNKFIFWNSNEHFLYDDTSRKWEKEALAAENNIVESEKLMQKIERNIQLGDPLISPSLFFRFLVQDLEEVGVHLNETRLDRLFQLCVNLNNKSCLWCNRGWTPEALGSMSRQNEPPSISFGPGLREAFANGDLDKTELERMLTERGIRIDPL